MPSYGVAYKKASATTEVMELDERLWDHVRTARSLVQQRESSRSAPSAVVVRSPAGDPVVVVVLMDREPQAMPDAEELCLRFNLTPREAEVALLLAERLSCKEVANRLNIGFHTARSHTERILTKVGVRHKRDIRHRLLTGKPNLTVMAAE